MYILFIYLNFSFIKNLYWYLRILSIDVAFGASSSALIFFYLTRQPIYYPSLLSLSLIVWLIYTLDHLIDAKNIKIKAILPRHRFHQDYFKEVLFIWLILFVTAFIYIYYTLFPLTVYLGLIGIILVIIHFILVKLFGFKVSPFIQKEFGVAFIYTFGVSIAALSTTFISISFPIVISFIEVFLLASINLLEFSFFEISEDVLENQTSLARALGEKKTKNLIIGLIGLNYIISLLSLFYNAEFLFASVQICFIIMNSILLMIILEPYYFKHSERYRAVGDAVFLIPVLLLFL